MKPIQQSLPRLATVLGLCAVCLGASSNSCTFFGIGRATGAVTIDLATEVPADSAIAQVVVPLSGLEFTREDGTVETLTFRDPDEVNLLNYRGARTPLRVFTDERLPEGVYTGVRLVFDDDVDAPFVLDSAGREYPLALVPGNFAALEFTSAEGRRNDAFTLSLDLRLSLDGTAMNDDYELTPVLRAVRTRDAGRIEGIVTATCPAGTSLSTGGAVYLFEGENIQPDDHDGAGVEPLASAPVRVEQVVGPFRYALRFLPEGRYTIALTCRGHEETPGTSEDLRFQNVRNVRLDRGATLVHDIG